MKSIFRATALLSGSSVTSILISLASTKVLASILHPSGYGYYGLLQSFVAVVSLLAGMGMSTAIVRLGAGAATAGDHDTLARVRAGAWLLTGALGVVIMTVLILFRAALSLWALGGTEHAQVIPLMGLAVWFTVALNVQNGILNACHRVEALAACGIATAVLTGAANIVAIALWGARGTVPAVVGGAVATWAASRWFLWRNVPKTQTRVSLLQTVQAARALFTFGFPFTASSLVGTGVQLALPIFILHLLNTEAVAYYKAAAAISVGYLGFLVTAMGQDYYPRISAVRHDPAAMVALIHEQYRLVMLLATPMILGTLALVPYIVPLVFSRNFGPSAEVLEWQLIGDLFKFSSWTMAFAVLARCRPSLYFCTESIAGALMLVSTWLGAKLLGLPGLGIAFLLTYAAYYAVVRTVLRREIAITETAGNLRMMGAALSAALIIRVIPYTPMASYRTLVALLLAAGFSVYSVRVLWRDYIAGKTWLKPVTVS